MKKLLLKILVLVVVIIAVNGLLFSFLHLPFSWGFYYDKEKCLEANAGSYNVLLMGSSRIGRQVDPLIFDSLNAAAHQTTTSINLGMDGVTIAEVYYQFHHVMSEKDLHPKYILVEMCDVDTFTYENMHTTRKKYYYNTEAYCNSLTSLTQSGYSNLRKLIGSALHTFNFLESAARFNELNDVVKLKRSEKTANYNCTNLYDPFIIKEVDTATIVFNGVKQLSAHAQFLKHTFYLKENKDAIALLRQKPEQVKAVDQSYLRMVNDMIETGKKNGVQVIFMLPPKVGDQHYRTVLPVFSMIKPENRIDLSDPAIYPEFYDLKYAYDLGHLDIAGSVIYTSKLSEQFLKITKSK